MSTETAPESCPFCGAQRWDQEGETIFRCGTWNTSAPWPRKNQTIKCIAAERERLTRERDEARALVDVGAKCIADMARANSNLLARVKLLDEAGDFLADAAEGCRELLFGSDIRGSTEARESAWQACNSWKESKDAKP